MCADHQRRPDSHAPCRRPLQADVDVIPECSPHVISRFSRVTTPWTPAPSVSRRCAHLLLLLLLLLLRPHPRLEMVPSKMQRHHSSDVGSEPSQSQSQQIDITTLTLAIKKSKQQAQSYREKREKEIERVRLGRLDQIHIKLNEARASNNERLRATQRPKLKRLQDLLQQKKAIEDLSDQRHISLANAWTATLNQISQAVQDCQADWEEDSSSMSDN
ncbi:hypothetical protein CERZMDRAFT_84230 [Cercospora zeae-maydis SCOH1-5]|uniref:Uncharacterized protein n=1 Tax=Cercospora zeae-maydis SCOH1-5 TaxID=717836 RepID=A0A6A6FGG8_9PEZI|nr:hypothetical protein CERZMDRAFT_84230 [Cercospora zeae-maydis SCOH1-5]